MDKYDYVIYKPELNDQTLAHFLGGAHKYVNKYMGKNGKWIYVYNKAKKALNNTAYNTKNKVYDMMVRNQRKRLGLKPEDVTVQRKTVYKNGRRYLVGVGYKGDSGRAKSTGSSSGNKGYTRSNISVFAGRLRAGISRQKRDHEKLVANKIAKNGIYRPTSRKKNIGKGSASVKINGIKGLGLNAKQALMRHRVAGRKEEIKRRQASESVRKNNAGMKKDPRYSKKKRR